MNTKLVIIVTLTMGSLTGLCLKFFYFGWNIGREKFSSDGKHVLRFYRTIHPRDYLPTMPGDSNPGYGWVRVYDSEGRKLEESYEGFLGLDFHWGSDNHSVYSLGGGPSWTF